MGFNARANLFDDDHRLERERIHLLLIDDARRGLEDVLAGRTQEADAAVAALQERRAGASTPATRGALGYGSRAAATT